MADRRQWPARRYAAALGVACLVSAAGADVVSMEPSKDNTLYESEEGVFSNGKGAIFAGRNAMPSNSIRRGLVAFDVAAVVPAGSRITSVTLQLRMSQTIVGNQAVSIHRLLADWGEGNSNAAGGGGGGAPAAPGDATWIHTFFPKSFWAAPGGDFVPMASATQTVGPTGFYSWGSTSQMVADVQGWLDDPAQAFGWLIRGNESVSPTAKRFDSRENLNESFRPMLTVEFTPCAADTNGSGTVDVEDLLAVIMDWGTDGSASNGDVNNDGTVNVDDLVEVLLAWGAC
jgi:hypothetical protein